MRPALLSQAQIQAEVLEIRPDPYFERLVDQPGMLVLRAKSPRCDYQGIHIALSTRRRIEFSKSLRQLCYGNSTEVTFDASFPSGRAWFNLYTSGIDFGNWRFLSFSRDSSVCDGEIWGRFIPCSTVKLRLNADTLSSFVASLDNNPDEGLRLALRFKRDQKPMAEPHNLWLWKWSENSDG